MTWLVMQKCNEINQRAEMLILMDAICAEGTKGKNEKRLHCTSKSCVQAAQHRWIMKEVVMVIFYESNEKETI